MNYSLHIEHCGIEGEYRILNKEQVKSNCNRYMRLNRLKRVENAEGTILYEYAFEKEELLFIAKELCIDELKQHMGPDALTVEEITNKPWEYLRENNVNTGEDDEMYASPYLDNELYDTFFETIESPLRLAYVIGHLAEDFYNNRIPWVKIRCDEQEYLELYSSQQLLEQYVQQYKLALNTVDTHLQKESIILPKSIQPQFCKQLFRTHSNGKLCIPIYSASSKDSNHNRIPLVGYSSEVVTEVKVYFTNAVEVIYTAYHVYRNAKDHRYQYKKIQSQHIEHFLINSDGSLQEVNLSNEAEYDNRKLQWDRIIEEIVEDGELNLTRLYDLNKQIEKPFLKNRDYYISMLKLIDNFARQGSYEAINNLYFLLGFIDEYEYTYHSEIGKVLLSAENYISSWDYEADDAVIIQKSIRLIAYFLKCLDIAPNAGILKVHKRLGQVFRTLMQIEIDRSYSVEFCSDDYLAERYKALIESAK